MQQLKIKTNGSKKFNGQFGFTRPNDDSPRPFLPFKFSNLFEIKIKAAKRAMVGGLFKMFVIIS